MDLRRLRYFLTLAEELNFTRAARRCNISQPPLSRAIAQLEVEIGAPLLVRDTHRVVLTAAGEGLASDAGRLLNAAAEAAERARKVSRGERGTLRLGFGGSAVYSLWPRLVAGFRSAAPDVSVRFLSMPVLEQIEALREDRIDIGLLRLPIMDELLATERVYDEKLMVALPKTHPLSGATGPVRMEAFAADRFVAYEPRRGFSYHADLHALCRLAGFDPVIAHEASSTEAVIGIVSCGEGIAVVPASAERLRMYGVSYRRLAVSEPPHPFETVTFGLSWRAERPSPVAQAFIKHVRDQGFGSIPL